MLPIQKYVEQNKIKLSQDEIKELFDNRKLNKTKIIQSQLPLVLNICASFQQTTNNNIEDLFSYGLEALNNAFETFNPDANTTFTTYAKKCIENGVKDYRIHINSLIRKPIRNTNNITVPVANVFSSYINNEDESTPFDNITDEDNSRISDEDALIKLLKDNLKPVEAYIIIQYFGLGEDKKKTLAEIGDELNRTKEAIRLRKEYILNKLKSNERFLILLKRLYHI